jgi:hypothetical protein
MNALIDQTFQHTYFNYLTTHPIVLMALISIIAVYYIFFLNLGDRGGDISISGESKIIEIIMWGILIVLVVLNGSNYMFNIDIITLIKNLFSSNPEIAIIIDPKNLIPEIPHITKNKKQVFHISNNKYNYDDSKAICSAYGGRLANLDEMNKAYKDGASWCSYGWSDDQMILYPTQQKTLDKLKTIKGYEKACGRKGVNGGYIDNTNKKYGVNCYGVKPSMTGLDLDYLDRVTLYPETNEEKKIETRIDYWKSKLPELRMSPFNDESWSS